MEGGKSREGGMKGIRHQETARTEEDPRSVPERSCELGVEICFPKLLNSLRLKYAGGTCTVPI